MKELIKKKKIIISLVVLIIICIIGFVIYNSKKSSLSLKDKLMIEYGEKASENLQDYIDFTNFSDEEKKEILDHAVLKIEDLNIKEGNDFPEVGEYKVIVTYLDQKETTVLSVKDTTRPEFKEFSETLTYTRDCTPKKEELAKKFTAKDLSEVTIVVDDSNVDYAKEGEYKATVKAMDASQNEVAKTIIVKVTSPTIKLNQTKLDLYKNDSVTLNVTVKGKNKTVAFKSSDTTIASVSKKGKITAKNIGTATITATANGVKTKCIVTVKNEPVAKNTTTESSKTNTNTSTSSSKNSSTKKNNTASSKKEPYIVRGSIGNSGKVFNTKGEAIKYANYETLDNENGKWFMYGYEGWTIDYSDGTQKWTINFYDPDERL